MRRALFPILLCCWLGVECQPHIPPSPTPTTTNPSSSHTPGVAGIHPPKPPTPPGTCVDLTGDTEEPPSAIFMLSLTIAIGVLVRKIEQAVPALPYTVLMFTAGVGLGVMHHHWEQARSVIGTNLAFMEPELLLFIFLPVLIFESAFSLNTGVFKKVLPHTLILAGPGLVIAALLTALVSLLLWKDWEFFEGFLFGSIISATDPVAVVALLKSLGADQKVSALIEGESLLNDGVAIVMFDLLKAAVGCPDYFQPGRVALHFARVALGGPVIGLVSGRFCAWAIKKTWQDPIAEIAITLTGAYMTFYVSEAFVGVSGVLALVVFGLCLSAYSTYISPESEATVHSFWELAAWFANSLIFVLVGVEVAIQNVSGFIVAMDYFQVIVLWVAIVIIRFLVVFVSLPVLNLFKWKLDVKNAVLCSWGGLRGAVGLALALSMKTKVDHSLPYSAGLAGVTGIHSTTPSPTAVHLLGESVFGEEGLLHQQHTPSYTGLTEKYVDKVAFYVSGIVVLTLVINGISTRFLVRLLHLAEPSPERQIQLRKVIKDTRNSVLKTIRVWQTDQLIGDAAWDEVFKRCSIPDPWNLGDEDEGGGTGEKVRRKWQADKRGLHGLQRSKFIEWSSTEKARRSFLAAFNRAVWERYQTGLSFAYTVRTLEKLTDEMTAVEGAFFDNYTVGKGKRKRHWITREMADKNNKCTQFLKGNCRPGLVAKHSYDLGTTFLSALERVALKVELITASDAVQVELRQRSAMAKNLVQNRLEQLSADHPTTCRGVKTKFVSRLALNNARATIQQASLDGLVTKGDAEVLREAVSKLMHSVATMTVNVHTPKVDSVLRAGPWWQYVPDLYKSKLLQSATIREYQADDVIMSPGEAVITIGVPMSGIIRVDVRESHHFLGPGRVFNVLSLLTDAPSSTVTAHTSGEVFFLDNNILHTAMRENKALEKEFWRMYAVRTAIWALNRQLPYSLWESHVFKMHVEGGILSRPGSGAEVIMWPKYDYVLVYGHATCTVTQRQYVAPCSLPTLIDIDHESMDYRDSVDEMRRIFSRFDRDGDGTIDGDELVIVVQQLGYNFNSDEVRLFLHDMDRSHQGAIKFAEFVQLIETPIIRFEDAAVIYRVARHKLDQMTAPTRDDEDLHKQRIVIGMLTPHAEGAQVAQMVSDMDAQKNNTHPPHHHHHQSRTPTNYGYGDDSAWTDWEDDESSYWDYSQGKSLQAGGTPRVWPYLSVPVSKLGTLLNRRNKAGPPLDPYSEYSDRYPETEMYSMYDTYDDTTFNNDLYSRNLRSYK